MSNVATKVPGLCWYMGSGQAVVRLNGRDFCLGPYGSIAAIVSGKLPAVGEPLTDQPIVLGLRTCWLPS